MWPDLEQLRGSPQPWMQALPGLAPLNVLCGFLESLAQVCEPGLHFALRGRLRFWRCRRQGEDIARCDGMRVIDDGDAH
eukprot:8692036-Lingulodinium_polyedra.AAC.1